MWAPVLCTLIPLVIIGTARGRMLGPGERCEPRGSDECAHGMLCEEENVNDYRCKEAPTCAKVAAQRKKDIESGRLQDALIGTPECDSDGNYKPRQCAQPLSVHQQVCSCVDRYTGRILGGYTMSFELHRHNSDPDQKMTCACAQRRAIYVRQGDASSFPRCESRTGNYPAMRCGDKFCACVDYNGKRLEGYKVFRQGESSCRCARDMYDFSLLLMVGRQFYCDDLGRYEPVQCRGSQCFCADEMGEVDRSGPSVPIHLMSTLKCEK